MRKPLPLLAYLALAACSGIEVTNPSCAGSDDAEAGNINPGNGGDPGTGGTGAGTGGTGGVGGAGGGVEPVGLFPGGSIEVPACPGGTGRLRLAAVNPLDEPAFVELLDGPPEIELLPSEFELEPSGTFDLAFLSRPSESDVPGTVRSSQLLLLISSASGQTDETVEVKIPIRSADKRVATVLCETSWPCEGLSFEGVAGTEIREPVRIVNDGCSPVAIEALQVELGDVDLAVDADGPTLPLELGPGESWDGALVARSDTPGVYAGKVIVASDDSDEPSKDLLFSVTVTQ